MQILKMHNLTQNYRINLAARGILQSHGTLRHMTVESNNGIDYVTLASDPDLASLSIELSPSSLLAVKDCPPSLANAVKGLPDTEMSISRFMYNLLNSLDD
jgi:hypothetical protein